MVVFSGEVHHLLTEAGWHPGRAVATQAYQQAARAVQMPWLPAAAAFLSEVGGLHGYFARQDHSIARVQFEVQQAATVLDLQRLRHDYAPRVPGSALSIIGQAYTDPLCLLVASNGTFYGACEEGLYYIGATVAEALEAIVMDLPFEEV